MALLGFRIEPVPREFNVATSCITIWKVDSPQGQLLFFLQFSPTCDGEIQSCLLLKLSGKVCAPLVLANISRDRDGVESTVMFILSASWPKQSWLNYCIVRLWQLAGYTKILNPRSSFIYKILNYHPKKATKLWFSIENPDYRTTILD